MRQESDKIDFIAEVSEGLADVEAGRVITTKELIERLSFSVRTTKLHKELKDVQQGLNRFERNYGKPSEIFLKEYQAGTAGDDMNLIEWASHVTIRDLLLAKRVLLQI
jgi:hypothetical protein